MFDWFSSKKKRNNLTDNWTSEMGHRKDTELPQKPKMPEMPRMDISGSGIKMSNVYIGGNSTVTINGQSFQVPGKANVSIKSGKVFINGEPLTDLTGQTQPISIEWKGEPPNNLEVSGQVVIHGNVNGDVSGYDVNCKDVLGSVSADGSIQCGNVGSNVESDGDIQCSNVNGDISASGDVSCDNVGGSIEASGDVNCEGNVSGDVSADGDVSCQSVGGDVEAGGDVSCGNVEAGSIEAGGDVQCGDVSGDIDAGGNVSIRK